MTSENVERLPRLNGAMLVAETVRIVVTAPPLAWAAIAGWTLSQTAYVLAVRTLVTTDTGLRVAMTAGATVVNAIIYALWSGVCLRLYLRRRFGRPDRDYLGYVLIELGLILATAWPGLIPQVWRLQAQPQALLGVVALVSTALTWVLAFPLGRLVLWPTARLVGDPRGRAGFSWRAMGGWAIWNYLFARVLIGLPQVALRSGLVFLTFQAPVVAGRPGLESATAAVVGAALLGGILANGLHAATYRQRLGPATRDVGDVFA